MIIQKEKCCGCGLCVNQCRFDAIKMLPDQEGFYYPEIDIDKCVNCGKCRNICPALNDVQVVNTDIVPGAYAGYSVIKEDLLKSSSGGVATAISKKIIKDNGVVFGVRHMEDYKGARFAMASTVEELDLFSESKYVETNRQELFSKIQEQLCLRKKVLVIGLPCDIAAVRMLVGNPANLYTCKLICRSNTSNKALWDYLDSCEQEQSSKIKKLSYRYKQDNQPTLPTKIRIEYENGYIYIDDFTKTDFGKAFQIFARPSCLQCKFKTAKVYADLTIGDFQGLLGKEEYFNINGVSLICHHTEKGQELIHNLPEFYMKQVPYDEIVKYNWMITTPIPESPFRAEFSKDFVEHGLKVTCDNLRKNQNKVLDEIKQEFIEGNKPVAIWGVGDTASYLFERLEIEKWNIRGMYDSSAIKIGKQYKEWEIQDIKKLPDKQKDIDTLIVLIPSEKEEKLDDFLKELGWEKRVLHVGKYKFYRG